MQLDAPVQEYKIVRLGGAPLWLRFSELEALDKCAWQCYAMLCYAMLCYAMLCYAVLCLVA